MKKRETALLKEQIAAFCQAHGEDLSHTHDIRLEGIGKDRLAFYGTDRKGKPVFAFLAPVEKFTHFCHGRPRAH